MRYVSRPKTIKREGLEIVGSTSAETVDTQVNQRILTYLIESSSRELHVGVDPAFDFIVVPSIGKVSQESDP